MIGVSGLGFWVTGFRLRLSGLGFRIKWFAFLDLCLRFQVSGYDSLVSGFRFWVSIFEFRVSSLGFQV